MNQTKIFNSQTLSTITRCSSITAEQAFLRVNPPLLQYEDISKDQEQHTVIALTKDLSESRLRVAGQDDPGVWEHGWGELAESLKSKLITLEALKPQYFHDGEFCRLGGQFVKPTTPFFEYWVGNLVRAAFFIDYLDGVAHVAEFGCGTGLNLLLLSKLYENVTLAGYDWAQPSKQILEQMEKQERRSITTGIFNMLSPKQNSINLPQNSAILTVHALEQVGEQWPKFLRFVLDAKPTKCLFIEPVFELYENSSELDNYSIAYHQKRGYLKGLYTELREMEKQKLITIKAIQRTAFGGKHHEAYTLMAWQPTTSVTN